LQEKHQVAYKGKHIRIIADFSKETQKARRAWNNVLKTLKENKCQLRKIYPAKLASLHN
jgi:hypothetical protein